jgi:hypothetical protein
MAEDYRSRAQGGRPVEEESMPAAVDPTFRGPPGRRPARAAATRSPAAALAYGLLFFACLQAALAAALEARQSRLRDPEFAARVPRLRARLTERPGAPLVLVLGSSRTLLGLRPASLPPLRGAGGREPVVFNASLLGAGPFLESVCLRRLLAAGVRPDWVVVEYWPPTEIVEAARGVPPERLAWDDLAVLARWEPDPARLYGAWGLARLFPFWTYHADLLRRCAPAALPPAVRRDDRVYPADGSGWTPCTIGTTPADRSRLHAETLAGCGPFLRAFHPSPAAARALRDLLATCRRERIAAVLLYMPEASPFRACYPPPVRAELDAHLRRLARECGVPLVDAREWCPDEDFADGVHLLPGGAEAFTARFGREVLQPALGGE